MSLYGRLAIGLICGGMLAPAFAFDSGSTGSDGDLHPSVSAEIPLPPSGVLNYRSVNIPSGVTITFKKNATNTPVTILSQGDIIIDGTIDISGGAAAPVGHLGDGSLADDGLPGKGGPGGYDGGHGGIPWDQPLRPGFASYPESQGGTGLGPGGGGGGLPSNAFGGIFQTPSGGGGSNTASAELLPLIGGSGGGGGSGGQAAIRGTGGAGGGGAILLAATGSVRVNGFVNASGASGAQSGQVLGNQSGGGGNGAGGSIRVVATRFAGKGTLVTTIGGVIRIETEFSEAPVPTMDAGVGGKLSFSKPGMLFFPEAGPSLRIARVGAVDVPAAPIGNADVKLAANEPNPVAITVETRRIPVGASVQVSVTPATGPRATATSPPTVGSLDLATSSVSIDIPPGPSVISASATFAIPVALREPLSRFAQGERVERIKIESVLGQRPRVFAVTQSGRELEMPESLLAMLGRE